MGIEGYSGGGEFEGTQPVKVATSIITSPMTSKRILDYPLSGRISANLLQDRLIVQLSALRLARA